MSLQPGTRFGDYDVLTQIGAGGMGEVYQAKDTRLKRDVALKVLPDSVARDADRLARFQREAELLATLNHPNIAAIYGLEDANGVRALVLELVEGPTLADRIARGALPLDEALPIARQIADALDAAHEHGMIHRDLKPANIKVRPDGRVKVLDFGLAKVLEPSLGSGAASLSPTITSPAMTQAGVVLGTAAYMSPEQARGRAADKRSDVWAFGCVLYEMLTGTRVFAADEMSDTIAAVLRAEPDWTKLPSGVPEPISTLLKRCLEKDHTRRLRDIGDARLELETSGQVLTAVAETAQGARIAWAVAVLAIVTAAGALVLYLVRPPEVARAGTDRLAILPPAEVTSSTDVSNGNLALSPDGRMLAFTASGADGTTRLWIRPMDSLLAAPVPGTEAALSPFWSPDSRSIGFFAGSKLKRVDAAGGPVQTIADATPTPFGGTWNAAGVIVFSPGFGSPLLQVSASGGVATPVSKPGQPEGLHTAPRFLPDGRRFLFSTGIGFEVDVYVGSLDNMPARRVFRAGSDVSYAAPGYLLFLRQQTLVAQRFDPGQLKIIGDPIPIAQDVARLFSTGMFSASDTGTVVYTSLTESRLTTVDRTGRNLSIAAPAGEYNEVALSPDGTRVAFGRPSSNGIDVWVRDLDRGTTSRLTSQPTVNNGPVWSPNGETIAFATGRNGALDFYQRPSNGTGSETPILPLHAIPVLFASDWSSDGRFLAYYRTGPTGNFDLWVVALDGARTPTLFLGTEFNESQGQFSPDGRWMAYVSDESGAPQVYVQSFPTPTERVTISTNGGSQPRWRRDGKELFYLAADRKLMAATIVPGTRFTWEAPRALFETALSFTALRQDYAVWPDGQRFLLHLRGDDRSQPMIVVRNWPALLSH